MSPRPRTLGALLESGYRHRDVKDEIRENLRGALQDGRALFPGIVGFQRTVIPQLVNALLARHDLVLLGLRGQAKTRLLRQLGALLDAWAPIISGSEINESPLAPITGEGRRLVAEHGHELEIDWLPREERYREKLATPDVTIADLIGDVDPLKAARDRLTLSSPGAILYGILPRTHRGIFAINELPDLQPRIQVGLLNILQERDIQIRGFPVRFPIDVLLVFTANPEDYTNRGSIITPLKDRIDSQIITHYPRTIDDALTITAQEAWIQRNGTSPELPRFLCEIIEGIAMHARQSEYVDQSSGVSARLPITAMENLVSAMEQRSLLTGQDQVYPRVLDLHATLPAITGKVELVYEGEQEGVSRVAEGLVGAAVQEMFTRHFPDAYTTGSRPVPRPRRPREVDDVSGPERDATPYTPLLDWFAGGGVVDLTDAMPDVQYRAALDQVPKLADLVREHARPASDEERYLWMELVLEGLCQRSLLAREDVDRGVVYVDLLGSMLEELR
jgi:magnesium chelatase subunit I